MTYPDSVRYRAMRRYSSAAHCVRLVGEACDECVDKVLDQLKRAQPARFDALLVEPAAEGQLRFVQDRLALDRRLFAALLADILTEEQLDTPMPRLKGMTLRTAGRHWSAGFSPVDHVVAGRIE